MFTVNNETCMKYFNFRFICAASIMCGHNIARTSV